MALYFLCHNILPLSVTNNQLLFGYFCRVYRPLHCLYLTGWALQPWQAHNHVAWPYIVGVIMPPWRLFRQTMAAPSKPQQLFTYHINWSHEAATLYSHSKTSSKAFIVIVRSPFTTFMLIFWTMSSERIVLHISLTNTFARATLDIRSFVPENRPYCLTYIYV